MKNKILGLPLDADGVDRRAFLAGRTRAEELKILGMSYEQRLAASYFRTIKGVSGQPGRLIFIDDLLPDRTVNAVRQRRAKVQDARSRLTISRLLPTLFVPLCPAKRPQRSRS